MDIHTNLYKWIARSSAAQRAVLQRILYAYDDSASVLIRNSITDGTISIGVSIASEHILTVDTTGAVITLIPTDYYNPQMIVKPLSAIELGYLYGGLEFKKD